MKSRIAWIVCIAVVVIGIMLANVSVSAFDLQPVSQAMRGKTALFEDSSFIVSPVSWWGLSGCIPFALCSEIGIDSPWEDFMSRPLSDIVYWFISIYKFVR